MSTKESKKLHGLVKQKTHLGQVNHFFSSLEDMEHQFESDVKFMVKQFEKVTDCFNLRNPWDENVLAFIVSDMMAFILANAEREGINLEKVMKESVKNCMDVYRKKFAEE